VQRVAQARLPIPRSSAISRTGLPVADPIRPPDTGTPADEVQASRTPRFETILASEQVSELAGQAPSTQRFEPFTYLLGRRPTGGALRGSGYRVPSRPIYPLFDRPAERRVKGRGGLPEAEATPL
jgi:hypothetical protein